MLFMFTSEENNTASTDKNEVLSAVGLYNRRYSDEPREVRCTILYVINDVINDVHVPVLSQSPLENHQTGLCTSIMYM